MTATEISIDEQVAWMEDHIRFRKRWNLRRIAAGKISRDFADAELAAMLAILDTLKAAKRARLVV